MAIPEGYKALAKIGISYKGDYVLGTSYSQLDAVAYSGSTYLALIDNPVGIPVDDGVNWKYLAKGFPSDINDVELAFTEATIRENIDSGEKNKTIMGKIRKWFTDLTAAAFSQMITSYPDLMANTVQGYLADAQAVKEGFNEINSNLANAVQNNITFSNSIKETLLALDNSYHIVIGQTISTVVSDLPVQNAWFICEATRTTENTWTIDLIQLGSYVSIYKGYLYNGADIVWEKIALNSNLSEVVYLGELDASAIGNTININITPYKSLYIQLGIGNDKVTQKIPIEMMSSIQSMTLTEAGDGYMLNAYVTIGDVKLGTPKIMMTQASTEQWLSLMRVRFYGCYTV